MQTYELLASMSPGQRELAAQRWGLPVTTPRMLAAMLHAPRTANRVMKRGSDAGAEQLVRLIIEYGGATVPATPALERQADRLRGWFPFFETAGGWALPRDLAAAAIEGMSEMRFFVVSMLAHAGETQVGQLVEALGVARWGSAVTRLSRVALAITSAEIDEPTRRAAEATAALGSIPADTIASLEVVEGSRGARWRLVRTSGEALEIAPRELAERCGLAFAGPSIEVEDVAPEVRAPRLRLPTHVPVGALVTFSSARAADDALRLGDFRTVVMHRLDERRVVTREDCDERSALLILARLGFAIDRTLASPGVGT